MKYKFLLNIAFLSLFFIPFNLHSANLHDSYYYCSQIPEGNPFGLVFNKKTVIQIGVENLKKSERKAEPYSQLSQSIKWLNVTFILKSLTLHIGNQKNKIAQCQKTETISELNELLESFINSEKNKNTI